MKKFFVTALIISIALIMPVFNVFAEEEEPSPPAAESIDATVLNLNGNTLYHRFVSPKDIFFSSEGLYISTAEGSEIYNDGAITSVSLKADDYAYTDNIISLSAGNIFYGDIKAEGSYSAISAYEHTLYALSENTIYKFTADEGNLSEPEVYITSAKPITDIAACQDGCIYAVLSDYGYNELYVGEKWYAALTNERVIDLEYSDTLYVLTAASVIKYIEQRRTVEFKVSGSKLAVGDKVYVLTLMGSVLTISLDLNEKTSSYIIASVSDGDWFYYQPCGVDSRLGKIYVTDRDLSRVAIIDDGKISYLSDGIIQPVAAAADNQGNLYVANDGNKVARFAGINNIDNDLIFEEDIVDIQIDYDNSLYFLTKGGNVLDASGKTIRENVKAFYIQNGFHYLTDEGYIDDIEIKEAEHFCIDIKGNIFASSGNKIIAYADGTKKEYTIKNVDHIASIAISKVDSEYASYGDLILTDDIKKCVLVLDGSLVGSVNIKTQYTPPAITETPARRSEGLIGTSTRETFVFSLPIEGEISYVIDNGACFIICNDVTAPDNMFYCLIDDAETNALIGGFIYKNNVEVLPYEQHGTTVAKVNAIAPVYKYPTVKAPYIATYQRNTVISILPFAVNSRDDYDEGWYTDIYSNKWYRIEFGEYEGYILSGDINANFFSDVEMPKTNATVTQETRLYRKDEASGEFIPFDATELSLIAKDTRVVVETPFDTSKQYTKVVFYREGYGTIDVECFVRTEFIKYDGVDIVKVIAISVIIVAIITLILVIIYKRRSAKKNRQIRPPAEHL